MRAVRFDSKHDLMPRLRDWVLGFVVVLLLSIAAPADAEILSGRVVAVVDGDTIDILTDKYRPHRIRFAWTDAPESGQPHGQVAKRALAEVVYGKRVTVDVLKEDRYESRYGKRLIGSVYLGGHDVGLALVALGHVWHYEPKAIDQDSGGRRAYGAAQKTARDRHLGLWRDKSPTPPWLWRREAASNASTRGELAPR